MNRSSVPEDARKLATLIDEGRQKFLKDYARCVLRKYYGLSQCREMFDDSLEELKTGVFVTLKDQGELRGCIGFTSSKTGILSSLRDAAIMAATEDPRFLPLSNDEVESVELEITILDDPWPLESDDLERIEKAINIGKDGIIVESRFGRGLLLPQVATEWGFNAREFLEAASLKAGLDRDGWKRDGSKVYAFEALSF